MIICFRIIIFFFLVKYIFSHNIYVKLIYLTSLSIRDFFENEKRTLLQQAVSVYNIAEYKSRLIFFLYGYIVNLLISVVEMRW